MKRILLILFLALGFSIEAQIDEQILLISRNTGEMVLENNDTIRVFGFAENLNDQPSVPGPTLYMNEGDSIELDLWNVSQGAPHTIHLHGLDVNQQNDGVPHLSFSVDHMEHGYYYFVAPHAGTYIYHCHVASTIHVQAGMYGLIIVRPPDGSDSTWSGGYAFDQELSLFMSEIDTTWHNNEVLMHEHDTTQGVMTVTLPFYQPQFFLVNGLSGQQLIDENVMLNSSVNSVNYIRVSNIGFYGNRVILPSGLNASIVASDGRPLPTIEESDTVIVLPGERYGVLTEASSEFTDEITIEYFDLNTGTVHETEVVPVVISGINAIDELSAGEKLFHVYPNPTMDVLYVEGKANAGETCNLQIVDVTGKPIIQQKHTISSEGVFQLTINTEDLSSGIYFLSIQLSERKSTHKIFKK